MLELWKARCVYHSCRHKWTANSKQQNDTSFGKLIGNVPFAKLRKKGSSPITFPFSCQWSVCQLFTFSTRITARVLPRTLKARPHYSCSSYILYTLRVNIRNLTRRNLASNWSSVDEDLRAQLKARRVSRGAQAWRTPARARARVMWTHLNRHYGRNWGSGSGQTFGKSYLYSASIRFESHSGFREVYLVFILSHVTKATAWQWKKDTTDSFQILTYSPFSTSFVSLMTIRNVCSWNR
jgi:hypothetical protein